MGQRSLGKGGDRSVSLAEESAADRKRWYELPEEVDGGS